MRSGCLVSSRIKEANIQKVALCQGQETLTYSELNYRADALAAHLISTGLKHSASVAICLERSFDWVIAVLAVMRAGAAYVPVDDAWPDERNRFVVADSGASHVIAQSDRLRRLIVASSGARPIGVDVSEFARGEVKAVGITMPQVTPDDLAYIIYTSGTSGRPKGVEITHANLAHLVDWHIGAFDISNRDRASHLAGLGFDAAGWEIWPYLVQGASISIIDEARRVSPELLQQWLLAEQITVSYVPTALALSLTEMTWPANTPLRFLLTGGEKLQRAPQRALPFVLVNNYGPTECTVVSTSGVVEVGLAGSPSIGRPIDGVSIHILDEKGAPVPQGTVGELCIGGPNVGRGYRNSPELTARSFVPDAFSSDPGARMYRTGDMALLSPDGQIEFRGRADSQEKIRGNRIELEEIVRRLYEHPKVKFATVHARADELGEKRLIAYVMPAENHVPTSGELRDFLATSLPTYMVPPTFVRLSAFPLSPSGKVDETLLEEPGEGNMLPVAATVLDEASGPACVEILGIVRKLLKTEAIGPRDDFFLVGGHSLLGTQLILRIRSAFQVDVSLRDLFEARTALRLSELVENRLIAEIGAMSSDEVSRNLETSI